VIFFIARVFQSVASNALWITGTATLVTVLGPGHMGKITGLVATVTSTGTASGPVIAGTLFKIGGWWGAWTGVFTLIAIDIILRLLMIDKKHQTHDQTDRPTSHRPEPQDTSSLLEEAPLLQNAPAPSETSQNAESMSLWGFYAIAIRHYSFVAGVAITFAHSILITSFETTLTLHVKQVFGWGEFPVGLLFVALQGPAIVLSLLVGWLKDSMGLRYPTTAGFLLIAPCLWLLGTAGDPRFEWSTVGGRGEIIYPICVLVIGCLVSLLTGSGCMELTCTCLQYD
jgi:MFS family permease